MRPWSRTVLKVVIMAATVCSGVAVARYDLLVGDEGPGQWDSKRDRRDLGPTAHRVSVRVGRRERCVLLRGAQPPSNPSVGGSPFFICTGIWWRAGHATVVAALDSYSVTRGGVRGVVLGSTRRRYTDSLAPFFVSLLRLLPVRR